MRPTRLPSDRQWVHDAGCLLTWSLTASSVRSMLTELLQACEGCMRMLTSGMRPCWLDSQMRWPVVAHWHDACE